jgi:hypothetical protein
MSGYNNGPRSMARSLATYMDCPRRIKAEVDATFGTLMCVEQIVAYRAAFLRAKAKAKRGAREPIDFAQTDRDRRYERNMEASSRALEEAVNSLGGHSRW